MHPPVFVIAGSDPLAASGLQADLRHLAALGHRAFGVPTCLTEQDLGRVLRLVPVDAGHPGRALALAAQTGTIAAVKIGLVHRPEVVLDLAAVLRGVRCPVVLDPVITASSGDALLETGTVEALVADLLPRVTVVTPNLPELEALVVAAGGARGLDPAAGAAHLLARGVSWVLVKGGHDPRQASVVTDLLCGPGVEHRFTGPRHVGLAPRGTGCALSTALAAFLARGLLLPDAVAAARERVVAAILRAQAEASAWLDL